MRLVLRVRAQHPGDHVPADGVSPAVVRGPVDEGARLDHGSEERPYGLGDGPAVAFAAPAERDDQDARLVRRGVLEQECRPARAARSRKCGRRCSSGPQRSSPRASHRLHELRDLGHERAGSCDASPRRLRPSAAWNEGTGRPRILPMLIAGNWKMFKAPAEARSFAAPSANAVSRLDAVEVAVCPPYVSSPPRAEALEGKQARSLRPERPLGRRRGVHRRGLALDAARARRRRGTRCPLERRVLFGETDERPARRMDAASSQGCGSSPASAKPKRSASAARPSASSSAR